MTYTAVWIRLRRQPDGGFIVYQQPSTEHRSLDHARREIDRRIENLYGESIHLAGGEEGCKGLGPARDDPEHCCEFVIVFPAAREE